MKGKSFGLDQEALKKEKKSDISSCDHDVWSLIEKERLSQKKRLIFGQIWETFQCPFVLYNIYIDYPKVMTTYLTRLRSGKIGFHCDIFFMFLKPFP